MHDWERVNETGRLPRVAVVDEYVLQRMHAVQLLTRSLGAEVPNASSSLSSMFAWLRETDRTAWPHLIIVGVSAQHEAAHREAELAALRRAGMRILVVTSSLTKTTSRTLRTREYEGYVSGADDEEDFLASVRAVLTSRTTTATPRSQADIGANPSLPQLSQQELSAFKLYIVGTPLAEIAGTIGVQPGTAKKYLGRVRAKFVATGRPARTRLDLARIAWEDGYDVPTSALASA